MIDKEILIKNWDNLNGDTKKQILKLAGEDIEGRYFVPMDGERYYSYFMRDIASGKCFVNSNRNDHSPQDDYAIATGNAFRTEGEALFAGICEYYTKVYKTYIRQHTDKLDWNNNQQEKHFAYYSYGNKTVQTESNSTSEMTGMIYASSKHILIDAIEMIGEENFVKYVCGANKTKKGEI